MSQEPRVEPAELPPLAPSGASDDERHRAFMARMIARAGRAPSLDHYRNAYRLFGVEWPGDDEVRRRHRTEDMAS